MSRRQKGIEKVEEKKKEREKKEMKGKERR